MNKAQQSVSVLAICISIVLSGMIIAYKPGSDILGEFRFPSGVPPALGTSSVTSVGEGTAPSKTLSITGTGTVYMKSDQANIILGVYTEDKLASTAIDENASLMTSVIKVLKAMG